MLFRDKLFSINLKSKCRTLCLCMYIDSDVISRAKIECRTRL